MAVFGPCLLFCCLFSSLHGLSCLPGVRGVRRGHSPSKNSLDTSRKKKQKKISAKGRRRQRERREDSGGAGAPVCSAVKRRKKKKKNKEEDSQRVLSRRVALSFLPLAVFCFLRLPEPSSFFVVELSSSFSSEEFSSTKPTRRPSVSQPSLAPVSL